MNLLFKMFLLSWLLFIYHLCVFYLNGNILMGHCSVFNLIRLQMLLIAGNLFQRI